MQTKLQMRPTFYFNNRNNSFEYVCLLRGVFKSQAILTHIENKQTVGCRHIIQLHSKEVLRDTKTALYEISFKLQFINKLTVRQLFYKDCISPFLLYITTIVQNCSIFSYILCRQLQRGIKLSLLPVVKGLHQQPLLSFIAVGAFV